MARELERIRVKGYKSIRLLDIQLKALNVLIGANGSGKSNFISLFRLLNEVLESRLQPYTGSIGADNLLYYGRKTTSEISIELSFKGERPNLANGYVAKFIPSNEDTLIFSSEMIWFHDRNQYVQPKYELLNAGTKESSLGVASAQSRYLTMADHVISAVTEWKIYHFHDTSSASKMKQMQKVDDNHRLQGDASNIAAYLYLLQEKHPASYKKIVSTIKRVTPFFDDFVLQRSSLNPDNIRLQWRDVNSDTLFDANALSDGTLRFICLTTLLLQPTAKLPSVILIDEPELGLHPFAISLLAGMLRSAATKTQVIVSTQSVPLVNQFKPEDIIVVDRVDGQSTFRSLGAEELDEWMTEYSDYGLGDLWEKNILGGRPQIEVRQAS